MREEWRIYWKVMSRYLRYLPIGILFSLVPFVLNAQEWRGREAIVAGLIFSVSFGLVIMSVIFGFFAAAYAIRVAIRLRTGVPLRRSLLFDVILVMLASACGIWIVLHLRSWLFGEPLQASYFLPALALSALMAAIIFLLNAYRGAKEHALALRAAVAESKYDALEHQMRPHFLFNALNSLAELIESGHERAAEMTYRLSDLYRLILENSKTRTAPLVAELDIARRYLELEQLRFGARLNFVIDVDEGAEGVYLPSLIIQTLVENAVKHGIAKSVAGGSVEIAVGRVAAGLYRLRVENTGEPFGGREPPGTGLANTRARLDLLYGDKHQFTAGGAAAGRTVVSFFFTGERFD